jgi:hypothetical protein
MFDCVAIATRCFVLELLPSRNSAPGDTRLGSGFDPLRRGGCVAGEGPAAFTPPPLGHEQAFFAP